MSELTVPETAALERLLFEWEVPAADCTPMERAGFAALKNKGRVNLEDGKYTGPGFTSPDEFDSWFQWFDRVLGLDDDVPQVGGDNVL
tara:strand:+ start:6624 stop:6887 length:264 start_codon:yes stop_codon:yes gene_type:complete